MFACFVPDWLCDVVRCVFVCMLVCVIVFLWFNAFVCAVLDGLCDVVWCVPVCCWRLCVFVC